MDQPGRCGRECDIYVGQMSNGNPSRFVVDAAVRSVELVQGRETDQEEGTRLGTWLHNSIVTTFHLYKPTPPPSNSSFLIIV